MFTKAKHMHITYTLQPSPLGRCLIAWTDQGLCALLFEDATYGFVEDLQRRFPAAVLHIADDARPHEWVTQTLNALKQADNASTLPPLDLQGTDFQREVWQALRQIPVGETRTYRQVAQAVNKPKAVRAVAQACGANPLAVLIPCHRVIRQDGALAGYRWGLERKQQLLTTESSKA